jgi:Icc-related predicted phosphoesterase
MVEREEKKDKISKLKILAAGDIHGDANVSKRLAEKAEKEKVDLVILTGDLTSTIPTKNIIRPFLDKKQKVIFVPGNWETEEEANTLAKKYGIKNLAHKYLVYKNTGIFGIGSADWALFPDDEATFRKLKEDADKLKNLEKKIMISHIHASGTLSELSGIPGNEGLRKAIDTLQPDLFIHSHIHELEGAEQKIGKTRVINVGKKGKIFEI